MREQTRKWPILLVQLVQAILMAVLIGTTFLDVRTFCLFSFTIDTDLAQLDTNQSSIRLRSGVIFFCAINQGVFGALITVNSFPADRTLSLRERAAGTYQVSAYFVAKNCAETLVSLPMPIIFSCIVYWLVGLQVSGPFLRTSDLYRLTLENSSRSYSS